MGIFLSLIVLFSFALCLAIIGWIEHGAPR